MQSILGKITTGVSRTGIRMVVAGQEKMGKTTFTADAPNALLIPFEVGFAGITIPKVPMIQNWSQFQQLMGEIYQQASQGKFTFSSLIMDSTTALERHIHDHIIAMDKSSNGGKNKTVTMESAHGGYGKAYTMANTMFGEFLAWADYLAVYCGINIILTSHVFSSKIIDPTSGEYDSWDLQLHSPKNSKTYGKREYLTQWADVIGFLYEPMYVTAAEGKSNMVKAMSQNKGRVLAVSRTPAYTAGNRFGLVGEIPIPAPPQNGWNHFANALYQTKGIDLFNRS